MKKGLLLLSACFCMLVNINSHAQSRKVARDSTTVIIFNQGSGASASSHPKKTKSDEDNIIKIAPLGFISGAFPLAYERRITDYFSVQVAGGLTHKNYIRGAIQKEADISKTKYTYPWPNDGSTYDDAESIYNFNYRTAKMGYQYSVQPRFYYESEALEGYFIGLSYDFYRYNFEVAGLVPGGMNGTSQTGSMQQEHENITDFMVQMGGQQVFDRLTLEYSTGIGIRKVKGEKYAGTSNGQGGITDGMAPYTQSLINFGISFKLGYHF